MKCVSKNEDFSVQYKASKKVSVRSKTYLLHDDVSAPLRVRAYTFGHLSRCLGPHSLERQKRPDVLNFGPELFFNGASVTNQNYPRHISVFFIR